MSSLILKIRRRKGKLANGLYKSAYFLKTLQLPYWKPFYIFFYWTRSVISGIFSYFVTKLYREPLFKSLCYQVGRHFQLVGSIPYVHNNIRIIIGDNVQIYGFETSFGGGKVIENPILEIGDNSFIGPGTKIGVCEKIKIGNNCLIAARVIMSDNDGHPLDWQKRRKKESVGKKETAPIIIEDDAWIGDGCFICKGVKVGRGAIIGARSVVTKDVLEFTVVAGNPAKFIKVVESIAYEDIASR